jgi:hypothetical protein
MTENLVAEPQSGVQHWLENVEVNTRDVADVAVQTTIVWLVRMSPR